MTFLDSQNFAMVRPLEYTSTASTGGGGCMSLIVGAVVFFLFVAVMQPSSRGWYPRGCGVAAMKADASGTTVEVPHSKSSKFHEANDVDLQELYDADTKKVVVVFATWCSHCTKLLNAMSNEYKDHVVLADGDKCKSLSGHGGIFNCKYYPTILVFMGRGQVKQVSTIKEGVAYVTAKKEVGFISPDEKEHSVASGLATLWATQFSQGASS